MRAEEEERACLAADVRTVQVVHWTAQERGGIGMTFDL